MIVQFEEFTKEIEKLEDVMDIDFQGCLMVQFEKQGNDYIAVNSMNGWGENTAVETSGKKLIILK